MMHAGEARAGEDGREAVAAGAVGLQAAVGDAAIDRRRLPALPLSEHDVGELALTELQAGERATAQEPAAGQGLEERVEAAPHRAELVRIVLQRLEVRDQRAGEGLHVPGL